MGAYDHVMFVVLGIYAWRGYIMVIMVSSCITLTSPPPTSAYIIVRPGVKATVRGVVRVSVRFRVKVRVRLV